MPYAEVCIDRSAQPLSAPLTYAIPDELSSAAGVGAYVLVPLQKREATGFIVGVTEATEVAKTKPLLAVLSAPLFAESDLQLARWMSSYYHAPLADALNCITPPRATTRLERTLVWHGPKYSEAVIAHDLTPAQEAVARAFHELGAMSPQRLQRHLAKSIAADIRIEPALRWMKKQGWVHDEFNLRPAAGKPKLIRAVELVAEGDADGLTAKQRSLLRALRDLPMPQPLTEILRITRTTRAVLNGLVRANCARLVDLESRRLVSAIAIGEAAAHTLTVEQSNAVARIEDALAANTHQVLLLHGVTASGKTEVYLRAIESALACGRSVIVLVPEIALTAQALDIFLARFPGQVAILHSALSPGERYDEWMRLKRGEAKIALGPRSAAFAPLKNVGLLIVDEEHESSYKQENSPRYHAREVALFRARADHAVVVLGSATPSLETVFYARRGAYRLIQMQSRILARPLPTVEIVDLRADPSMRGAAAPDGEPSALSQRLREALIANRERGEQAMLFLNRRGFSSVIFCPQCGVYERCPNCAVSLTYHRHLNRLRCHHCNFIRPPKEECPKCKGTMIGYGGPGTERVEREVRELLPGVETLRMDRDTTTRKGAHGKLLRAFRGKKASVLIGTQMIAKGLDFPGVTLVGVVNADVGLHAPDWRAGERTFQLLVQVAGRAGRGETPGHVIVQTFLPSHYAVLQAVQGSFASFAEDELRYRQQCNYPPFTFTVNVVVNAKSNKTAQTRIVKIAERLNESASQRGVQDAILGPAPCPFAKLRGEFRWHLFVRAASRPRLHQILSEGLATLKPSDLTGMTIDVDPQSVL